MGESQTVTIDQVPADSLIGGENYYIFVRGETISSKMVFSFACLILNISKFSYLKTKNKLDAI